jgi:hypothetical protein
MDSEGRIGRLHVHCRFFGASQNAGTLQTRLERLAREQLAEQYDTALQTALGDDPAVYVLRNVHTRLALRLDAGITDLSAAGLWGKQIARSTVRSIAYEPEGENKVRFDSQADFVVHFVIDLIQGIAWDRWFYGAFKRVRSIPLKEALISIFEENRDEIPAILAGLHRQGGLDALLSALGVQGRQWLWTRSQAHPQLERAGTLSLLRITVDLVDRLGIWRGDGSNLDTLLEKIDPHHLITIHWQDTREMAEGMLALCRALRDHGDLHLGGDHREWDAKLLEYLAPLDWLDRDHVSAGLKAILHPPHRNIFDLPVRPVFSPSAHSLTPRQQQLLDALRKLIDDGAVHFDSTEQKADGNALRLYSALLVTDQSWNGDAQALAVIQRLMEGWQWIQRSETPDQVLQDLKRGKLVLAGADPGLLALFETLGQPGLEVLQGMTSQGTKRSIIDGQIIQSECAGTFLLLRALYDARLTMLYRNSGCADERPGLDGILLPLSLAWSGALGLPGSSIDPGLQWLADQVARSDISSPLHTLDDLDRRWDGVVSPTGWQAASLQLLVDQRLWQPETMFLYRMEHKGIRFLVAGDASGNLWPFVAQESDCGEHLQNWLQTWQEITGIRPQVIADASALRLLREVPDVDVLNPLESSEPVSEIYAAGSDRLRSTLDLLAIPSIQQPAWNLTLALTANSLLRLWARWLKGFGEASVPFLLDKFIHRPGRLLISTGRLGIELEPGPLDIVLELSGYLAPARIPWLGDREIHYQIRGSHDLD